MKMNLKVKKFYIIVFLLQKIIRATTKEKERFFFSQVFEKKVDISRFKSNLKEKIMIKR